jgi:putative transposase
MARRPAPSHRVRTKQLELGLPRHGGWRPGAGRKPAGPRPQVSHAARQPISRDTPVHVTLRLVAGLASLRRRATYATLREALVAGSLGAGYRVVHHSVQTNHVHLIIECDDATALARGMNGLTVRLARRLNRVLGRRGEVFADRYHARLLRTPAEVRAALLYVLNNRRRHAAQSGVRLPPGWLDPFSSAASFAG